MSKFYFFTNPDKLREQKEGEAFGPLTQPGQNGEDQFRVCSKHVVDPGAQAVAVCDGIVMVRPTENSALVNVIIYPTQQPTVGFQKITCYIYRGIKRDSLFNTVGGDLRVTEGLNMLTETILETQKKRIEQVNKKNKKLKDDGVTDQNKLLKVPDEHPKAEVLGYSIPITSDDTITDAFVSFTSSEQQPFLIKGGMTLGEFNEAACFEIVADRMIQETSAHIIGLDDHVIAVAPIPASSEADALQNLFKRHKILNFIDPVVFFGMFYKVGLKGIKSNLKTEKFDDETLPTLIRKFSNSKNVYIDLRNNQGLYFNFYRNSSDLLKITYGNSDVSEEVNYLKSSWPLLILDHEKIVSENNEVAELKINFDCKGYAEPTLSIYQGYVPSPETGKGLASVTSKGKVLYLQHYPENVELTEKISIQVPLISSAPLTALFRATYVDGSVKDLDGRKDSDLLPFISHKYDMQYPISEIDTPDVASGEVASKVFFDDLFINDRFDNNWIYSAVRGVAKGLDLSNNIQYVLWTYPSHTHSFTIKADLSTFSPMSKRTKDDSIFKAILNKNLVVREDLHTVTQEGKDVEEISIPILHLQRVPMNPFHRFDPQKLEFLSFSQVEWDTIKSLQTSFITGIPVFIGLKLERGILTDQGEYLFEYEIVLQGIVDDVGNLKSTSIPTTIKKIMR